MKQKINLFLISFFIIKYSFSQVILEEYNLPTLINETSVGKTQVEGIKIINSSTFWLTSEQEKKGDPKLFKIKI